MKYLTLALLAGLSTPAYADADQLLKVQEQVNLSVKFVEEENGDKWKIPSINGRGDCEDFALLKRQLLIDSGWDANDISLIIVYEKNTELKKNTVVKAHVTLYVKSLDMILESPSVGNARQGLYPEAYSSYMNRKGYNFYCKVENINTNVQFDNADKRCGVRKKELI